MNLHALPFYASKASQQHRSRCREYGTELASPQDRFLPFVVKRGRTGQGLDCVLVYDAASDVLAATVLPIDISIDVFTDGTSDYYVYFGAAITGFNLACGRYYLDVKGQFSEVFTVVDRLDSLLKVEWKNSTDIAGLPYSLGFQQRLYLNAAIGQASYPYREEGDKDGNGEFVALSRSLAKSWEFDTQLLPDFLLDVIQSLTLHDSVSIGDHPAAIGIKAKVGLVSEDACASSARLEFSEPAIFSNACAAPLIWAAIDTSSYAPKPWLCGGPTTTEQFWEDTGELRCITVNQTFTSAAISELVYSTICPAGSTAEPVTYLLAAGYYISTVSQADADAEARAYFNGTAQAYANSNAVCSEPRREVELLTDQRPAGGYNLTATRTDTDGNLLVYYSFSYTGGTGRVVTGNSSIIIPAGLTSATKSLTNDAASQGSAQITSTDPATYIIRP